MVNACVGSRPLVCFLIVETSVFRRVNYECRKTQAHHYPLLRVCLAQQHCHDGVSALRTPGLVCLKRRLDGEVAYYVATYDEEVARQSVVLISIELPHHVSNRRGNTFDEYQFLE